jgi:hypothetical protein
MFSQPSTSKHIAVLIGIDFYLKKPLHGCVRDVNEIEAYLRNLNHRKQINLTHLTRLVASNPTEEGSHQPPENPSMLPTFDRVTSCLSQISSLASSGDHVYIHFSGHGTRDPDQRFKLVLLDGLHISEPSCLSGLKLAEILNELVVKGLRVTMVLDCCFSGGTVRSGDWKSVRYLDYEPSFDSNHSAADMPTESSQFGESGFRNASTRESWLIDPNGYTILTACGPHEIARELTLENGEKRGALSYFLVRMLKKLGESRPSHLFIYRLLCALFREWGSPQNPQFFGNMDFSFFGDLQNSPISNAPFVPVCRLKDKSLWLEAGQAQGVSAGDMYALYPPNVLASWNESSDKDYLKCHVLRANSVTSEFEVVDVGTKYNSSQIRAGWIARRLNSTFREKIPIIFARDCLEHDELVRNMDANQNRSFKLVPSDTKDAQAMFKVGINRSNRFEIFDQFDKRINTIPELPLNGSSNAIEQVLDKLEHLAKYRQIERMENILENGLCSTTDIQLSNSSSKRLSAEAGYIELKDEEQVTLSVWNNDDRPLYLNVFGMMATWEVMNALSAENIVIDPKQEENDVVTFQMTVPEEMIQHGQFWCEDILKIFITSQPTSFSGILMPSLWTRSPQKEQKEVIIETQGDWIARNIRIRTHSDQRSPSAK